MRRRLRRPPAGQEETSIADIQVYDLDEMELEELERLAPGPEGAGRPKGPGQAEEPGGPAGTGARPVPTIEQLEAELRKSQYRNRYGKVLRSTAFSLLVVAAAAVLIAVLLLPVLRIDGTSMTETLQDGDIVVALNSSRFKTGDVVAFYYNNSILVKRVIATAGDWVDMDEGGNVYVNGELIEEPYITEKAYGQCDIQLPCQVPDGRCFVMGDHRATSIDSRNTAVGCVDDGNVVGRIVFRIWPMNGIGLIN